MATKCEKVMNEDVRALKDVERRFRKPKHTKEHIKKDSNRYIVELDCESNSSPMIFIGNQMVYS